MLSWFWNFWRTTSAASPPPPSGWQRSIVQTSVHGSNGSTGGTGSTARVLDEEQLRALVHLAPVAVMVHEADTLRVLYANRKALAVYEVDDLPTLNRLYLGTTANWGQTPFSLADIQERFRLTCQEGPQRFEWLTRTQRGGTLWEEVFLQQIWMNGSRCVVSASFDITAQKLSTLRDALRQDALLAIAQNRPLCETLDAIVRLAQAHTHDALGCVLLLSDDGEQLELAAAPDLPDALSQLCASLPYAARLGTCGEAAYQKRTIVSTDLLEDPAWEQALDVVKATGIRSCWSLPMLTDDGALLGTLALYYPTPYQPRDEDQQRLNEVLSLAVLAIQRGRERSERQRRNSLEKLVRDISLRLLSNPEGVNRDTLDHVLRQLGEFVGADRCYIMQHSADGESMDNTHEWCAPGVPAQIHELQEIPTHELQNWLDLLQSQHSLIVTDATTLPPNERWAAILSDGNIVSMLFVPMMHRGTLVGLLGFDAVRQAKSWDASIITPVQVVADLLVNALIRQQLVDALRHDADHDPLTSLPNRRRIEQVLNDEAERVERYGGEFSLIMFDIDHFKIVNDTFGHELGDDVLRILAGAVDTHKRRIDQVARWGGEEFILVLPQTPLSGALQVAEKLRAMVAAMRFPHGNLLTISLGVANYTAGDTLREVIHEADTALYAAKQRGRNCVVTAHELASHQGLLSD